MAQKPVADAFTLELEPVVEANLTRHLATEESGTPTNTSLSTMARTSRSSVDTTGIRRRSTLPRSITDAFEVLVLIKDNLAGHHRELVEHFILEDYWGRWIGRWTAEEHLHAIALREYLVVTREVDPPPTRKLACTRGEGLPRRHVLTGRDSGVHGFHRAHARHLLRNLAAQIEEPILAGLVDRIARDEVRHEQFFANLVAHCLECTRDETIAAIAAAPRH